LVEPPAVLIAIAAPAANQAAADFAGQDVESARALPRGRLMLFAAVMCVLPWMYAAWSLVSSTKTMWPNSATKAASSGERDADAVGQAEEPAAAVVLIQPVVRGDVVAPPAEIVRCSDERFGILCRRFRDSRPRCRCRQLRGDAAADQAELGRVPRLDDDVAPGRGAAGDRSRGPLRRREAGAKSPLTVTRTFGR